MNGFDILKARKQTGVSQSDLADALGFQGGRGGLTDIENGNIDVTADWALKAIALVQHISEQKKVNQAA
ncbi:MAG: helix-turn-helix transcriptional regulator [Armatimonadota bacterium]